MLDLTQVFGLFAAGYGVGFLLNTIPNILGLVIRGIMSIFKQ